MKMKMQFEGCRSCWKVLFKYLNEKWYMKFYEKLIGQNMVNNQLTKLVIHWLPQWGQFKDRVYRVSQVWQRSITPAGSLNILQQQFHDSAWHTHFCTESLENFLWLIVRLPRHLITVCNLSSGNHWPGKSNSHIIGWFKTMLIKLTRAGTTIS